MTNPHWAEKRIHELTGGIMFGEHLLLKLKPGPLTWAVRAEVKNQIQIWERERDRLMGAWEEKGTGEGRGQ